MSELEYSWEDIIIDPNDIRARGAIYKKVYVDNNPHSLLKHLNMGFDMKSYRLDCIESDSNFPFEIDSDGEEIDINYVCFVIDKESKQKYVPYTEKDYDTLCMKIGRMLDIKYDSGVITRGIITGITKYPRGENYIAVAIGDVELSLSFLAMHATYPETGEPFAKLVEEEEDEE